MLPKSQPQSYEPSQQRRFVDIVRYNVFTLWLMTANDFKTMIVPSTAFAFFTCSYMGADTAILAKRLPRILIWTWINLLAFTANNQRRPSSIVEDSLNKPWRPIPAGRLTPGGARAIGMCAYLLAQATSFLMCGGGTQSVLLWILGYIYHDHGGADRGFIIRNLLNAAGFTSFASGALEVGSGCGPVLSNLPVLKWLCTVAAVVATTVHSQDMYDQSGDAAANRRTVPLVIGDLAARRSIATAVAMWSFVCPLMWKTGSIGYIPPGILGLCIAQRSLCKTGVDDDRITFRIYNIWLMSLYWLPFLVR